MKIRLLATSDLHGTIFPYRYSDNKPCNHGFLNCMETMNSLMTEHTLKIDNGDLLEGSPFLTRFYKDGEDTINPMTECLNMAHYDYFNLGNHDFNYGQENLLRYIKDSNAKCIVGNVTYQGKCLGEEYVIHRFDENHAIALIGVVTRYILNWEKKENLVGIEIEDAFSYVERTVEKIKRQEKVNGIVVVYHGGFEKDLETGRPTESLTGENQGYEMCEKIKGIDVIISGHQHRSIATKCLGVTVTQTAFNGKEIACIDWDLDAKTSDAHLVQADQHYSFDLPSSFEQLEQHTQSWLDETLGEVMDADLRVENGFEARLHKTPVITFINQVQMEASGADLSGNALFNDAVGFQKNITMRDIVSTYVYPNTTIVYRVTGKILKEYLEKCAEYFAVDGDRIVVAEEFERPKPQHYNYDMVDGLEYTIKASNPVGSRIVAMTKNGQDVTMDDSFTLALSNYRAAGGGNFFMFEGCEVVKEIQTDMVTLISEYLLKHPKLYVNHHENVKVIL